MYRDSAGRTRKETLDDNGQVVTVVLSDPTTGTSYVLDGRGLLQSDRAVTGTVARITAEKKMTEAAAAAGRYTVTARAAVGGGAGGSGLYVVNGVPELQVLVLTRHSDPRTGETTYRLSNIDRSEPAKSLFDPPAGK